MLCYVGRKTLDLLTLILGWNYSKDRFIESAADHFHLFPMNQSTQQVKVFGVVRFHPKQERAGIVQAHANRRMLLEQLCERQIALLVATLQDVFKIADRLMRVN